MEGGGGGGGSRTNSDESVIKLYKLVTVHS